MSYREMRNFTEMMRALGYNRLISMENFRNPNFQLTAEILQWLVTRYDQNADVSAQNIDTEQDRVIFIKMVAHFMMTRAHVRLNTKRLYQADGYAVRELLKVTTLLYNSMMQSRIDEDESSNDISGLQDLLDANKLREIKETRQLASQIISRGAGLSDALRREVDLREERMSSLNNQLETTEVERAVERSIQSVEQDKQKQQAALNNIASDEATLDGKIEKKKSELDRNQKRLSTLQSVRPAYMDEYEQLEGELSRLYEEYLLSFRNLAWLENQYEELSRHQLERAGLDGGTDREMTLGKMADQLRRADQAAGGGRQKHRDDDFEGLLDGGGGDEDDEVDDDGDDDDEDDEEEDVALMGMAGLGRGKTKAVSGARNFGGMMAGGDGGAVGEDDDDDEDDGSEEDDEDDDDDDEESGDSDMENSGMDDLVGEGGKSGPFGGLPKDRRAMGPSGELADGVGGGYYSGPVNGSGRPRGAEHNSRVGKARRGGPTPANEMGDDF